jgi:hypothetical protein
MAVKAIHFSGSLADTMACYFGTMRNSYIRC